MFGLIEGVSLHSAIRLSFPCTIVLIANSTQPHPMERKEIALEI